MPTKLDEIAETIIQIKDSLLGPLGIETDRHERQKIAIENLSKEPAERPLLYNSLAQEGPTLHSALNCSEGKHTDSH